MCCIAQQNHSIHAPAPSGGNLIYGIKHPVRFTLYHFFDAGNGTFAKTVSDLLAEGAANFVLGGPILTGQESMAAQRFLTKLNDSRSEDLLAITVTIAGQH